MRASRAVRDLHGRDLGGDRDGLGDAADLQGELAEVADFRARQSDIGDGQGPEAGELDAEHVAARIQCGEAEEPRSSETTVRMEPVFASMTLTVAPGRAAPVPSTTVPMIVPVPPPPCANAAARPAEADQGNQDEGESPALEP